jgi:ABC-type nitrate/sulfonate/bicarbonate transport system substrate-binding protein
MSRITAFAAALFMALLGLPPPGGAAEAVVLQLSGPAQFEFAGYYAALWLGYYREAGFAVTIRPGGLKSQIPLDPVREVAEGRAQFGIGSMQLVIRRAQGLPVLLVAPIFQQSGAAVYYRADSDFSSPAVLVNARVGRLAASDILDIELATTLRAEGIDPARMKAVTIEPSQIVAALADRSIDAAIGSGWTVPWQARERGLVLKSFNPAGYRVDYYGDSLFTMQRFAATETETVRRFRAASLKGWEYALLHPNDIIARLVTEKPGDAPFSDAAGFARFQSDVALRLSRYPDIPLGYSNPDRWTQIAAGMVGAGALQKSADLTDFVYEPAANTASDTQPRTRVRLLPFAGALAAAAALVGAVAWAWLKFRRRRAAAPVSATAEPPTPPRTVPSSILPLRRASARPVTPPAPPPLPPPTDLNAVLAPLERRIRQMVRGKVRCRYSLLTGLWACRTESTAVAAAVLDLVGSAAAATDADGTLIVGTRNFTFDEENIADYPGGRLGRFARITVRDNGRGLSDAELDAITDTDLSVRPAVAKTAATMARLGGFLRVESAEGVGTAVHLYFARVPAADEVPPPETAQVAE